MRKINAKLKKLLLKIAGEKYRELVTITLEWTNVCGTIMAERSKVVKYENRILYIKVINHIWLQEFVLNKPTFLEKLRKHTKINIERILYITE